MLCLASLLAQYFCLAENSSSVRETENTIGEIEKEALFLLFGGPNLDLKGKGLASQTARFNC